MNNHKDDKQEDTFRVIDRRLFTSEGDLRQEAVEEERRQEAAEEKREQRAVASQAAAAAGSASSKAPAANNTPPSPVFKNLLAFLARNAELIMAGLPDPRTGRTVVDIESLRQIIDMMEVLRDKTKGNLATEDEQILTEVIGDLKVSFLQLQQAATAQAATQRAGRKP